MTDGQVFLGSRRTRRLLFRLSAGRRSETEAGVLHGWLCHATGCPRNVFAGDADDVVVVVDGRTRRGL